ncbi:MAG TPA: universal stress protein [Baekduia sp.]|nr:universal stress protein [Baekduia sp.]
MFQNVIVGVDGREGGRDAIALARALGPAGITLVASYPAERTRWRGAVEGYFELLRKDADELLEQTRRETGVEADVVACPDPSPARAIQRLAAERGADLIVIGSAHHGPVARLLLGDVGRGVLHGAPCPVAVAPRGFAGSDGEIRRVGVGFDDSDEARAALALAAEIAGDRSGVLTVHSAWDVSPVLFTGVAYSPSLDDVLEAERAHATEAVDAALADLPRAGREIARGRAEEVLEAAAENADLLVVGSRGWGPARRIAVGSTSDHLVHHAACPVLVVPRPAEAGASAEDAHGDREPATAPAGD